MKDFFKKEKPLQGWTGFGGGATSIRMGGGVSPYIEATGGVKSTPGDGYVYHEFTLNGGAPYVFTVENAGAGPDAIIDLCVVGGGGGAGNDRGGGGGAGGFRITTVDISGYGTGDYPIGVGQGGPGNPTSGNMPTRSAGSPGGSSYFSIPSGKTPSPFSILSGGGGGGGSAGGPSPTVSPTGNSHGKPGEPYPFPTDSTPHPNSVYYPGSGGGSRRISSNPINYGGSGAGADFNSYPGDHGPPSVGAGGGGGAGSGGPESSNSASGGAGKQLPWALPTWGWGQNNPSGESGQSPTSPDPTRYAGPTGQLPWDYGWFCGGGGGGGDPSSGQGGGAGAGNGSPPTATWGGPPNTGSDGWGYWAANGTGSGGGGSGSPSTGGGKGGPGGVFVRYPQAS